MGGVSRTEGLAPYNNSAITTPMAYGYEYIVNNSFTVVYKWVVQCVAGGLVRGNLNNGAGITGVGACGNGNNAVSNANWNIVARISE